MSLSSTKLKLARQLIDTTDAGIINHIKAVFTTQSDDWWEQLPANIRKSIDKALKESDAGKTISHAEAMKPYKKWLKK